MNKKFEISASVLNMDFSMMRESIAKIEETGIDSFHLDIMDGNFVNNISFGPDISKTIISLATVPVHSHLMVKNPEKYADRFFDAGTESVTVHAEVLNKENRGLLDRPRMGLSLNPDIPLEILDPYLEKAERILVMSVMAGFGGQKFMDGSLKRIESLRNKREKKGYSFLIEVDGGINGANAPLCIKAGADVVIVGSWITLSDDPSGRVKILKSIPGRK